MCQSFCGKELPRKVKAPIQMDRAPHQLCRTTREKGLLQRAVRIDETQKPIRTEPFPTRHNRSQHVMHVRFNTAHRPRTSGRT
ncbi:hypothetical protein LH612_31810, partial [Klebsiella pneumoniae]|nr:hypothetical protein [Klebsiella pneumoniae]